MSSNDIYFKVAKVVSQQLNIQEDKLKPEDNLNDIGADALDQIEILMNIEEQFNIEITDEQADKIIHVKDLVHCVQDSLK